MPTGPSPQQPVSADDVLTMQFTLIKKGGYDSQEVDAFLDRVAATMDLHRDRLPESAMTGDDVRSVEFTLQKRGGYATREVDDFLDRVVAVLGAVDTEAPAATPAPAADVFADLDADLDSDLEMDLGRAGDDTVALSGDDFMDDEIFAAEPAPEPAPEPPVVAAAPSGAAVSGGGSAPQLHDPEGAAQRLLAAAQQAADSLTAEAKTYAETARSEADHYAETSRSEADAYAQATRSEADDYAQATRSEADEHAERVTTSAETQAASIREVAADEARRVAEEARAQLMGEMSTLEARKADLEGAVDDLEAVVGAERSRLLRILESLQERVAGDLPTGASATPGHAAADTRAATDDHDEDDEDDEPVLAGIMPEASDDPDATAALDMSDVSLEVGADLDDDTDHASDEGFGSAADEADADADQIVSASRSVFDLDDEEVDDDTSADWLDEQLTGDVVEDAAGGSGEGPAEHSSGGNNLFDIEAEDDWDADAASSGASSAGSSSGAARSGDSFFDELSQADDDGLGPLDDDTDAALSAFFEAEEEAGEGKWRDRFGPGRN